MLRASVSMATSLFFLICFHAPYAHAQSEPHYVLLFNTTNYNTLPAKAGQPTALDTASLALAARLANQCSSANVPPSTGLDGCIAARFLIELVPSSDHSNLDSTVSQMASLGYQSYIVAGSSDFGTSNLLWDSGAMCWNLQNIASVDGLYLHEVLSASKTGTLTSAQWTTIQQMASCASTYNKKIVWEEWAGGNYGFQNLLGQLGDTSSQAYNVISTYKNVFVFMWGNNQAVRAGQLPDMLLAQSEVENNFGAGNNPLKTVFPHGISSQDWLWSEMGGCNAYNQVTQQSCAPINMPQTVGTALAIADALNVNSAAGSVGGTYFEFEGWWSGVSNNFSGQYDPCYFNSISDLTQFLVLFYTGYVPTSPVLASTACTQ